VTLSDSSAIDGSFASDNAPVASRNIESLQGNFCETTTVDVEDVHPDHRKNALATLDAICWLLSFASQSRVLCYGDHFPVGTTTGHFKSVGGIANSFRPAFDLQDADAIKGFVEKAYPTYCKLRKKRKLPAVFDYLVWAEHPSQPTEIRLLLLFITLESLKDTYARAANIPYLKGYFRKPPVLPSISTVLRWQPITIARILLLLSRSGRAFFSVLYQSSLSAFPPPALYKGY
jgi:hypothetical protein